MPKPPGRHEIRGAKRSTASDFQTVLQKNLNANLDPKIVADLNKPWSDPKTALSAEDKAFLELLVKHIESGVIDPLKPSSILNQAVYDSLPGPKKARADIWVNATLALIRQVYDFFKNPYDNNSDMMIDMVRDLRSRKEKLEAELGDVLKI
jgi:hypothetical protein